MERFYLKKNLPRKGKTLLGQVLVFIKEALICQIRDKNMLYVDLSKLVN